MFIMSWRRFKERIFKKKCLCYQRCTPCKGEGQLKQRVSLLPQVSTGGSYYSRILRVRTKVSAGTLWVAARLEMKTSAGVR